MIQISPDGTQLWVSNRITSTTSVIDTTNGNLIQTSTWPVAYGLGARTSSVASIPKARWFASEHQSR
jgi:YVTN family beta-propeller protein